MLVDRLRLIDSSRVVDLTRSESTCLSKSRVARQMKEERQIWRVENVGGSTQLVCLTGSRFATDFTKKGELGG